MFTGIIQTTGLIKDIEKTKQGLTLQVQTNNLIKKLKIGSSVAIDGTCFTIIKLKKNIFFIHAMPETIKKTIVSYYKEGNVVNIEKPLTLSSPIDGHFVLGHIDFTGKIKKIINKKGDTIFEISFPHSYSKYLAEKGSVTINGISLTISGKNSQTFTVNIIPYTMEITNLKYLNEKDLVNIEIDTLARYIISSLKTNENR
jgi:riboflavin synthase